MAMSEFEAQVLLALERVSITFNRVAEEIAGFREETKHSAAAKINERNLKALEAMEGGIVGGVLMPPGSAGPRRI